MKRPPREQLDVPLVWATEQADQPDERSKQPPVQRLAGFTRIWLAALADAGALLSFVGLAWGVAAFAGASLVPLQLLLGGFAGIEAAAALAVGCLWSFRATPGMLLMGIEFAEPLVFRRVVRLWFGWLACLALAGLPLGVGWRGRNVTERLAGARLSSRPSVEAA